MTVPFRKGPVFSDGAVPPGPDPLTLAMAVSTGAHVLYVDHWCDLVLDVSAPGTAADAYEFEVQDSDDGVTWATLPIAYGFNEEGIRVQTAGIYRKTTAALERWIVQVEPERFVQFRARRVAGGVDTTLLIEASAHLPTGRMGVGVPMSQITAPFEPYDGGGQAINIGAAATRTAQLTVGEVYDIFAEAPCYWTSGDNAVTATAADSYLGAGQPRQYRIPDAAHSYISCIRQLTDAAGGFHVCRAS